MMADDIKVKVDEVINKIRPAIQTDGGDLVLVGVEGKKVQVRLQGACIGCPMARMTLKQGIEATLRDQVDPEIVVEQVA